MRLEGVFVGTELLEGRLNTHSVEMAKRLAPLGLGFARAITVGDEEDEIARAVSEALERARFVLVFGGLGPTFDDLSREGVARALGRRLRFQQSLFDEIRRKFARRRLPMPPENRRQAFLIEGGRALRNARGSAPGQVVDAGGGRKVFLLPGPESEMAPMFERFVLPALVRAAGGAPPARMEFHWGGVMESQVDHRLRAILRRHPKGRFTILSSRGVVSFYATADKRGDLSGLAQEIRRRLGARLFAEGPSSIPEAVGGLLLRRKESLSLAESCTGGLAAKRVTDVPGSSRYFAGGLVAYSNRVKTADLGVSERLLADDGAVSAACAEAMADGARLRYSTDWAVSITGIAGPDGGTRSKPVGTVFAAMAGPKATVSRAFSFSGDRGEVRHKAASAALFWLWQELKK